MKNDVCTIAIKEEKVTSSSIVLNKIKYYSYIIIKRLFDIICGLLGCLLLIPITIVVKIITLISGDKTSIFFIQERIGKNGETFKLYKFRSMIPNADKELERLLEQDKKLRDEYKINKKLKDDPRITKIGKILRKTSLDEFPQMINILIGNMTMIGNRPYLPREKEDMGKYYKDIIKTKCGLTGYWQTEYRSNCSFEKRLELESYYSNHCSLKMDIKIFLKTFKVVFRSIGAK